ncbi:MAG: SUMF1/EgtB/PvdO family nonheme iron enzyme, partial [Polyangiaceae bacterium]
LVTDPPGARVALHRYVIRGRRLVPEYVRDLGETPILKAPLGRGSYLLVISAPGCEDTLYPVRIERGEHWDGCPPGQHEPHPIPLPRAGDLAEGELYVPAGHAWVGGDPEAPDSLSARRVWIDGFIVDRFPITHEQYLAHLNDLLAAGRESDAWQSCPRAHRASVASASEELACEKGPDGRFRMKERADGETPSLRSPVVLVSFNDAVAYARARSEATGRHCRLLNELEREKAVRGADGRHYPWGDFFDPNWACMLQSHRTPPPRLASVDAFPGDESPFGMRGGAGNSLDLCWNEWTRQGPVIEGGRLVVTESPPEGPGYRAVRGGGWGNVANHCRAAGRFAVLPDHRRSALGLRLGRSFGGAAGSPARHERVEVSL